jgi:hypothetical protein
MNSACNCCSVGYNIPPVLEGRFKDFSDGVCARNFLFNLPDFIPLGGFFRKINWRVICDPADAWEVAPVQEYDFSQTFSRNEDGFCVFVIEQTPQATFPCTSLQGFWKYEEGSAFGEDPYDEEEFKEENLAALENEDYFPFGGVGTYLSYYLVDWGDYPASGGAAAEASQYRVSHYPHPSCYLKVWIVKRRYQANIDWFSEVKPIFLDQEIETYTWNPTTEICIPNKEKRADDPENVILSDTYEIFPTETGIITAVSIFKYSWLPDYEPDDPILSENEVFSGIFNFERPVPDFRPDGFPDPTGERIPFPF